MKTLFHALHIFIMFKFVITGNNLYDQILNGILAVIAYIYAFTFTGEISNELRYSSTLMSFVHWTIRTAVSIVMIFVTRLIYKFLKIIIGIVNMKNSEIIYVIICSFIWIVVAEILKFQTGLNKKYW